MNVLPVYYLIASYIATNMFFFLQLISTLKHHTFKLIPILFFIFQHYLATAVQNINPVCSSGEFILDGMSYCHPMLSCQDVSHMKPIRLLAGGVVKNIWLVEWHQWQIVMAKLTHSHLSDDFNANIQNLIFFKGNRHVSNLIGHCGNTTIFSQYYPLGNALGLHLLFDHTIIQSASDRFQLCINYAQIVALLHRHSMIMCDSNSVAKTLTQYLVTDKFELILNDLDALPRLHHNVTKCGPRQVFGDLVAPEQEWPFPNKPFDDALMPPYTEKVDIWKIADICHWILGDVPIAARPRNMLYHIHSRCKFRNPRARPTADEVVQFYLLINRFL